MSRSIKKTLREEYDHLKKVMERILTPKKNRAQPQLALQPIRNKKIEG